jgi:hypothetical protein
MGDSVARLAAALQAVALVVADRSSGHLFQITVLWLMKVLIPQAGTQTSLAAAAALEGLDAVDESAAVNRLPNIILPSEFLSPPYLSSLTKAPIWSWPLL